MIRWPECSKLVTDWMNNMQRVPTTPFFFYAWRRKGLMCSHFHCSSHFPLTSVLFWILPSFNMKKQFFIWFLNHLKIGNHLLLSCKQAKRTGQKRICLASSRISWPSSPPGPCPRGVGDPGTPFWQAFCEHSMGSLVLPNNKEQLQGAGVVLWLVKWDMGLCQSH